jgi:hypothetical protein
LVQKGVALINLEGRTQENSGFIPKLTKEWLVEFLGVGDGAEDCDEQ